MSFKRSATGAAGNSTRRPRLARPSITLRSRTRFRAYKIKNATIQPIPNSKGHSSKPFTYPGATAMISSNGGKAGILWVLDLTTNTLQAYSAGNLHKLLYSTAEARRNRDQLGGQVVKFTVPTIANGKVYVGTSNSIDIYGLLGRHRPQRVVRPPHVARPQNTVKPKHLPRKK